MSQQQIPVTYGVLARIVGDTNNDLAQLVLAFACEVDCELSTERQKAREWQQKAQELHASAVCNESMLRNMIAFDCSSIPLSESELGVYKLALAVVQERMKMSKPI